MFHRSMLIFPYLDLCICAFCMAKNLCPCSAWYLDLCLQIFGFECWFLLTYNWHLLKAFFVTWLLNSRPCLLGDLIRSYNRWCLCTMWNIVCIVEAGNMERMPIRNINPSLRRLTLIFSWMYVERSSVYWYMASASTALVQASIVSHVLLFWCLFICSPFYQLENDCYI